jgi:uncharacterized membrane protein YdfJ with MMPL/SSD domain
MAELQRALPGSGTPATVVLTSADHAAADRVATRLGDVLATQRRGDVLRVTVPLAGRGTDAASERSLDHLRHEVLPAALRDAPNVRVAVTGMTANAVDLREEMEARGPIVFVAVLVLGFVLLLTTFRSIVVPVKAVLLNLLSVAAAYGVLVLVFQEGFLAGPLGFEPTGTISSWLPTLLFVILFGLSMDYHVYVLSRIREHYDAGMPIHAAVADGIRETAGAVTSAAAIMVGVFSVFITLGVVDLKQLGVGLSVAIALDATIVRTVLLPASMTLLGKWNWYLPRGLSWLPGRTAALSPATASSSAS